MGVMVSFLTCSFMGSHSIVAHLTFPVRSFVIITACHSRQAVVLSSEPRVCAGDTIPQPSHPTHLQEQQPLPTPLQPPLQLHAWEITQPTTLVQMQANPHTHTITPHPLPPSLYPSPFAAVQSQYHQQPQELPVQKACAVAPLTSTPETEACSGTYVQLHRSPTRLRSRIRPNNPCRTSYDGGCHPRLPDPTPQPMIRPRFTRSQDGRGPTHHREEAGGSPCMVPGTTRGRARWPPPGGCVA